MAILLPLPQRMNGGILFSGNATLEATYSTNGPLSESY